jgi:hypothetical protein
MGKMDKMMVVGSLSTGAHGRIMGAYLMARKAVTGLCHHRHSARVHGQSPWSSGNGTTGSHYLFTTAWK